MNFGRNRQSGTRAEQLRQKRQQTGSQSRRQTPTANPRQAPVQNRPAANTPAARSVPHVSPVVSRSIRYGTPLRQAVNTQPRRKVVYRVGSNGVETRLPSLPIIQFNWQWVSAFLTIGCIVLTLLLTNLSIFAVNRIDVEGLQRVTAADIQTAIQGSARSVFTFNKAKALSAISLAFPELKDVRLSVSLPDSLKVSAVERQPVMAWRAGDQTYWIDAEGVVMQPRGEMGELMTIESETTPPLIKSAAVVEPAAEDSETPAADQQVPVDPAESINYMDPAVLKAAIEMSALMPQGATLVYDSLSGMGWNDPGGWQVFFGNNLENIQFKQIEYQAIIEELDHKGITPVMVSVKHVDSPYYRTE